MTAKSKCYQLIGVPGAGKSTWVANQEWAKDCVIVSTDNHVEDYARAEGKTYNEVFRDFMPFAVKLMAADVVKAREAGQDIIWDQTSTTIASRKRKFAMLPDYEHIAVGFRTPARDELDVRLSGRLGKHIPKNVVDSMIAGWDEPELDEGFTEIWYAS
jgi:predicted kinase